MASFWDYLRMHMRNLKKKAMEKQFKLISVFIQLALHFQSFPIILLENTFILVDNSWYSPDIERKKSNILQKNIE